MITAYGASKWTSNLVKLYIYIDLSYSEAFEERVVLLWYAFNSDKAPAWISVIQSAVLSFTKHF
jgi:hypothetical protein